MIDVLTAQSAIESASLLTLIYVMLMSFVLSTAGLRLPKNFPWPILFQKFRAVGHSDFADCRDGHSISRR